MPLEDTADAPAPDATRLFAPDLLGRATRLPDLIEPLEPPPEPPARTGDFSFDDLDFEEPSGQRRLNQSQIFGESSVPSGSAPKPSIVAAGEALLEPEALADPLYSQTTFLDPHARDGGQPNPPPLPDLLAEAPLEAEPESDEDAALAEADTALDEELEATRYDPAPQPFSPDTAAALDEPRFERARATPADAATRVDAPPRPRARARDADSHPRVRSGGARSTARGACSAHAGAHADRGHLAAQAQRDRAGRTRGARRALEARSSTPPCSRRASRRWRGKRSARSRSRSSPKC